MLFSFVKLLALDTNLNNVIRLTKLFRFNNLPKLVKMPNFGEEAEKHGVLVEGSVL